MKRKAFTLIELLVVISIIALLLSILMPALGLAKQQGQYVVCRSNMKNMGAVQRLYSEDWDGKVIGGWYWESELPYYYGFDEYSLAPDASDPDDKISASWDPDTCDPKYQKWMNSNNDVWTCPAAIARFKPGIDPLSGNANFQDRRTISVNREVSWARADPGQRPAGRLQKITDPQISAETAMFFCAGYFVQGAEVTWHRFNRFYMFNDQRPFYSLLYPHFGSEYVQLFPEFPNLRSWAFRDGKENILFFDGHLEGRKYTEVPAILDPPTWESNAGNSFWFGD